MPNLHQWYLSGFVAQFNHTRDGGSSWYAGRHLPEAALLTISLQLPLLLK